jgi:glucan phosphoethanolaminetransferase (alkaline phosphatase superfamily)
MKLKRNIITPYLTFLFVVVGLSGILMLFHILDDYTKIVHELLGAVFVLFSILHVIINWKSLKSHFKKKAFIISGVVVLIFSVIFIILAKMNVDHEGIIIEKITEAPISESFSVLDLDYNEVEKILQENNIVIGESKTIKEIGLNNKKTSKDIIELIIK